MSVHAQVIPTTDTPGSLFLCSMDACDVIRGRGHDSRGR